MKCKIFYKKIKKLVLGRSRTLKMIELNSL